jgi:hypothetical protein
LNIAAVSAKLCTGEIELRHWPAHAFHGGRPTAPKQRLGILHFSIRQLSSLCEELHLDKYQRLSDELSLKPARSFNGPTPNSSPSSRIIGRNSSGATLFIHFQRFSSKVTKVGLDQMMPLFAHSNLEP